MDACGAYTRLYTPLSLASDDKLSRQPTQFFIHFHQHFVPQVYYFHYPLLFYSLIIISFEIYLFIDCGTAEELFTTLSSIKSDKAASSAHQPISLTIQQTELFKMTDSSICQAAILSGSFTCTLSIPSGISTPRTPTLIDSFTYNEVKPGYL